MNFRPDDIRQRCEPLLQAVASLTGHRGDSEPKPRKMRESQLHDSEVDEIFTRARQDGSEKCSSVFLGSGSKPVQSSSRISMWAWCCVSSRIGKLDRGLYVALGPIDTDQC